MSRIAGSEVELTHAGALVREVWLGLDDRFVGIRRDLCVIMPNHVHAIIQFLNSVRGLRLQDRPALPRVVGTWKSLSALRISRQLGLDSSHIWQSSFIDRVIRDELECSALRTYILQNPQRWSEKHAARDGM